MATAFPEPFGGQTARMTTERDTHNTQADSSSPGTGGSDEEISPAEFTKRMPEGQSAGPGAPETLEPTQGHGGETGPGGSQMRGMGQDAGRKNSEDDAHLDGAGAAATATRDGVLGVARKLAGKDGGDQKAG